MELREPKLIVVVGRKGVGKTYKTIQELNQYVMGNPHAGVAPRRVLVFDVNDEFEHIKALKLSDIMRFSVYPIIEQRRIRPFLDDGRPMGIDEMRDALGKILYGYRNGLLLIEDINKYLSDNLPQDLIGKIVSARHSDLDIICHFQSIGRITPKIWQNLNSIRYHKQTDAVEKHRTKFENYYEIMSLTEAYVNHIYLNGNKRINVYVDMDDEKIMVTDRKLFKHIVEEYLKLHSKKKIVPFMGSSLFNEGGKKKSAEVVLAEQTQLLMNQYLKPLPK